MEYEWYADLFFLEEAYRDVLILWLAAGLCLVLWCNLELQADFAGPQFPALSCQDSQHGLREEAWRSGFSGKAGKF